MSPCVLSSFSKRKKIIPSILFHHEDFLDPPPAKPITASGYELRPNFGCQA
jgi:hypothetical protein